MLEYFEYFSILRMNKTYRKNNILIIDISFLICIIFNTNIRLSYHQKNLLSTGLVKFALTKY